MQVGKSLSLKVLLPVLFSILFMSCEQTNNHEDYLEFYYSEPFTIYPMSLDIPCKPMKSGPPPENSPMDYLKISDTVFLDKFKVLYTKLVDDTNDSIDVEAGIQLLAHINGKTDTICMGTGLGVIINGKLKQDSPEFSKLISDKVKENYMPRFLRKKKM